MRRGEEIQEEGKKRKGTDVIRQEETEGKKDKNIRAFLLHRDLSKAGRWELFRAQSWFHEQSSGFFLCLIYPNKGLTNYKATPIKNVHFNFHSCLFFFLPIHTCKIFQIFI